MRALKCNKCLIKITEHLVEPVGEEKEYEGDRVEDRDA